MYNRSFFLDSNRNQQSEFNYTSSSQDQLLLEQQDLSYQTFPYQMTLNVPAPISVLPSVMDSTSPHITDQTQHNTRSDDADVLEGIAIFLADENANAQQEGIIAQQPTFESMQSGAVAELDHILENLNFYEQIAVIKALPGGRCLHIANVIIRNIKELQGVEKLKKLTLKELLILAKIFNLMEFVNKIESNRTTLIAKLTSIGLTWSSLQELGAKCVKNLFQLHELCRQAGDRDYLNKTVEYYGNTLKNKRKFSAENLEAYLLDIITAFAENNTPQDTAQELQVRYPKLYYYYEEIIALLCKKYPVDECLKQKLSGLSYFKRIKLLCNFIYKSEEFKAQVAASSNESSASQIQTRATQNLNYDAQAQDSDNASDSLLQDALACFLDENPVLPEEYNIEEEARLSFQEHEDNNAQQSALESMQSGTIAELDNMLKNLAINEQLEVIKEFSRSKSLKIAKKIIRNLKEFKGADKIEQLTLIELLIFAKMFDAQKFSNKLEGNTTTLRSKLTSIGLHWSNLRELNARCTQSLLQLQEYCVKDGNSDYLNKTVKYYNTIIKNKRTISKKNLNQYLTEIIKAVAENQTPVDAAQALYLNTDWLHKNSSEIIIALEKKYPGVRARRQQLPPDLNGFDQLKLLCNFIYESEEFKAQVAASTNEGLERQVQTSEDQNLAVSSLNVEAQAQDFDNEPDILEDGFAYLLYENPVLFDDIVTQTDEHPHDDNMVMLESAITEENVFTETQEATLALENEQRISEINTDIADLFDFSDSDFDCLVAEYSEEYNIAEVRVSPVEFHSNDQTRIYDPRIFASNHASSKRSILDTENRSPTKKVRQDRFDFN